MIKNIDGDEFERMRPLYQEMTFEAYGTSIQKIIDSNKDSKAKPQIESSDNAFKIVLSNRNLFLRQDH